LEVRARAELREIKMNWALVSVVLALLTATALAAPQAKIEHCGWLVSQSNELKPQPDPTLQPSDPKTLATPPTQAKAAYCERDTLLSYVGDERILKLGLPLIIRSSDKEGVLEANPTVLFNYHKVGDKYLPGRQ
jgi:hypothetical protein